ncbi:hypothetical protein BC835DRAFT_454717 [Cytidiella melzeri]|nr:hypothetical protein BC835DRAFT_454717 [Cytidiella melzeri]
MPFNHPFTTLANWDGKLYQANTSPSSSRHLVNSPSRLHRKEARRTLPEEKHRQLMPPPPPVLTSTGERQISGFDMMAMSPTSPDSFLTDSEDDRKYVAGMLLETDEARASSPAKPDHHWQVPISMVSPITDAAESAWPSSKASTSSSYLKHQSLTHNNPFMNIVVVSSNPIPQNPLSPSRKPPTHTQQACPHLSRKISTLPLSHRT